METTKFKTETVKTVAEYTVLIESALRSIREANSDDILLFRGQPVDEPLCQKLPDSTIFDASGIYRSGAHFTKTNSACSMSSSCVPDRF